jgi:hypothetical protein
MTSLKRRLLTFLLAGFLVMTIMATVGAHQRGIEFKQAKREILGTLVCKRVGEDTWAGTVKLTHPYRLAHGISLIQPESQAEPWKEVTVKGRFTFEDGKEPVEFERTSGCWVRDDKNEFFLPHPIKAASTLSVEISGLRAVWFDNELKLDAVNMLCGCERVLEVSLAMFAWTAGLISVVLGFLTVRAFTHPKPAKVVQPR